MADSKTIFRLDTIEARLKSLGDRLHDIANLAHDNKIRLDGDMDSGTDRETRLRAVEIYIEQQKGKAMQNKAFMGLIGILAGVAGELLAKYI